MSASTHVAYEKAGKDESVFIFAEKNVFIFIKANTFLDAKEKEKLTHEIRNTFDEPPKTLSTFEHILHTWLNNSSFPSDFSLSALYMKHDVLYLHTEGRGAMYIVRSGKSHLLIHGSKSASGYIKPQDRFFLCEINTIQEIDEIMGKHFCSSVDLASQLASQLTTTTLTSPFLVVDIRADEQSPQISIPYETDNQPKPIQNKALSFRSRFTSLYLDLRARSEHAGKQKRLTLIAMIIVFAVFIWSVGFGVQRRKLALIRTDIDQTKQTVSRLLDQAEQEGILNAARATALLGEADGKVVTLRRSVSSPTYSKEIDAIQNMIDSKRNALTKKEEKSYNEVFDFSVDNKNAHGDAISLDGDSLAVLDKRNGAVYRFSLEKKTLDSIKNAVFRKTLFIALNKDDLFFYVPTQGIYKDSADKVTKEIENDTHWKELTHMEIYNGNIYVLDPKASDITKYVVVDSGYSSGTSYFEGNTPDIGFSSSMTIDGSVYIGGQSLVQKYTGGTQDGFSSSFPNGGVHINKVVTNKELQKVYVWDKQSKSVFVLEKDGSYVKQIQSSIFKLADDIVVYQDFIYALAGSKLYSVSIN